MQSGQVHASLHHPLVAFFVPQRLSLLFRRLVLLRSPVFGQLSLFGWHALLVVCRRRRCRFFLFFVLLCSRGGRSGVVVRRISSAAFASDLAAPGREAKDYRGARGGYAKRPYTFGRPVPRGPETALV